MLKKCYPLSLQNAVRLWGLLDLCSFAWFVGLSLFQHRIPFYSDIIISIQLERDSHIPFLFYFACIMILLYFSLIISGILLLRGCRSGAILSYFQTPFRFVPVIPPSLFFILWPFRPIFLYISETKQLVLGLVLACGLVMISEIPKLLTIITWHRRFKKPNEQRSAMAV
jgi:hypothetical protein